MAPVSSGGGVPVEVALPGLVVAIALLRRRRRA
jgi:uncharacterized protein (TIGR03382 family)